ncbi:predicted protein [Histoplasma capsulatum G186AR]|uniref:Uncharacterized protein n=1 Tax=Ajellomyces capsulatus (strain G186AR / H82 / ATCC MYA-2454 / RMSCC 2432) TaxID=447093 RepID=C0NKN8_AJECG|nr:uncharacterized protein HCBG_03718 [Histoplasma capsulatum G186AR]EEH08429.1 predicted protein [Histoplasma capsulatum G186AR]
MALYDKIPHSLRDPENFPPLTLCSRLHSVLPLALKVEGQRPALSEVSNNSKTPWGRKPVLRAFAFSMTTMLIIYRDPGISVRGTVFRMTDRVGTHTRGGNRKARLVTLQEKIGSLESAGLGNRVLDIESIKDQV